LPHVTGLIGAPIADLMISAIVSITLKLPLTDPAVNQDRAQSISCALPKGAEG
jgi:hypothetical protein